jgi:pimeloyl-ACP methyl ester carboxylesterase
MAPGGRHRRLGASLAIVLIVVVGAGCSSAAGPVATSSTAASPGSTQAALPALPPPAPIVWSACAGSTTLQCGTVSVPVDYQHPRGPQFRLAVSRAPALDASDPGGVLLFNPGGPAESGNQILPVVLNLFPAAIRQRFDVVSFDPRGTGASDPLMCGTPTSALTSALPVPAAPGLPLPGTPVFTTMARACQTQAVEPFINTVDTARDMDRIRQALGVPTISFYGMSYGTMLGAVYADLFPHRVTTMVLDGAVDVNATLTQQAVQEAPAAEQSLHHLFATCLAQAPCPLGTDPQTFFSELATSLRDHPLPAPGSGDPYPVTEGDLDGATLFALSVTQSTGLFYSALIAAKAGNGVPLRNLALDFATDVDGAPLVDPLWTITCNDAASHPGPVAAGALARSLDARYPLVGAYAVNYTMGGCVAWPAARQPVVNLHPVGTPPILVIGNTGDPNTPIIGARHLAAIFPTATMATWKGWGHTWLLSGSGDTCMQQVVTRYLDGAVLPPHGTVCD